MTGFIAINARTASAPTPTVDDPSKEGDIDAVRKKSTKGRQPARKNAAAPVTESHVADPETARKPISGKGRKRANEPGNEPDSKRRKSGSAELNMPITKKGVKTSAAKDPAVTRSSDIIDTSSTDADMVSLASKAKFNSFRYSNSPVTEVNSLESKSAASHQVYMPQTSMDNLNQAQPQTTMQAIQCSQAGSSLLYSSSAGCSTTQHGAMSTPSFTNSTPLPTFSRIANIMSAFPKPQLPTPVNSDTQVVEIGRGSRRSELQTLRTNSGDFGEDLEEDEDEIIELAKRIEKPARSEEKSPPARARKLNIRETHEYDDYGGALFTEEERELLDAIKLPQDARRPIVRCKFPLPIMDRTSLVGVSNTSALRTCFRVGEALNTGCNAVRNNQTLILELYARITSSWREDRPSRKQHFVIHDLYHDKSPFINGTFELWDQSTLWDEDSRPFLKASASGIICRMIARMKRDGAKWRLEILSIWQADWDDVEHAADIYAKPVTGGGS